MHKVLTCIKSQEYECSYTIIKFDLSIVRFYSDRGENYFANYDYDPMLKLKLVMSQIWVKTCF